MSQLPSPRALLFDLDGTLVDSVPDLAASANFTRQHFGLPALSESRVASFVGDGARALLERSLADAGRPLDESEVVRVFRAHYLEHCLDRTLPYAGVEEALRGLASLPMAIVTNKPQAMAERIVEGFGWSDVFAEVVGASRERALKPDPAMLNYALEQLGHSHGAAEQVWMIGDSRNDILSGQSIRATTLAVSHGLGDVEELRGLGAHVILERFEDLVELARG